MRVASAVLLTVGILACASRSARRDHDNLLAGAQHQLRDAGSSQVNATVELAFSDAGAGLVGAYVTLDEDAPEGVHLRLALTDAAGKPVVTDRLVALCAVKALRGERVFIPLDASVLPDVTAPVAAAEVTFAARVGGCLRPTLRMETLLQPAGSH